MDGKIYPRNMTEENAAAWAHLDTAWREKRMLEWALMLEKRVAELDQNYRAYPWGRREAVKSPS